MALKVLCVLAENACLLPTQTSEQLCFLKCLLCASLRAEVRSFPKEQAGFCLL